MDAPNLSDEMALIFLYLAFVFPRRIAASAAHRHLFNSLGLVMISGLLGGRRGAISASVPVQGAIPIAVGIAAAAANWGWHGCCRSLGAQRKAIRLAYIHMSATFTSRLAFHVLAGFLVIFTERSV